MSLYMSDGMMTGSRIYTERSGALPIVCSEDLSSCRLTDLNRMTLLLHACIAWES